MAEARARRITVRRSSIAGRGVFALTPIRRGTRIAEYRGQRITWAEADRRYDDDSAEVTHTFLFTLDDTHVIDATYGGNSARYINHSCDPNCESVLEDGRVFIEAIRHIPAGVELTYDYRLSRDGVSLAEARERYPCRCGAASCRGTLMQIARRRPRVASTH